MESETKTKKSAEVVKNGKRRTKNITSNQSDVAESEKDKVKPPAKDNNHEDYSQNKSITGSKLDRPLVSNIKIFKFLLNFSQNQTDTEGIQLASKGYNVKVGEKGVTVCLPWWLLFMNYTK